ncbi:NADH-quinone oxidoreductase subunit J [Kordia jejudonensis]|uniref:NADH-quinone oxidoreductase subunit J n=1 Tax=Kordia jejudonensis TaxID=1348245 RepID=UPI000628FD76|nr:NADH-quinone oxidoreductase subunit J [Kordia jejudonensis]
MENETPQPPKEDEFTKSKKPTTLDSLLKSAKFWLALSLILVYIIFIIYLMKRAEILGEEKPLEWARYLFLFTGIEAIVFTAVGYIFGQEVSRKVEQSADQRVENEKNEKANAQKETEKAKKETEIAKENLIRLQEAVISDAYQVEMNDHKATSNYEAFDITKDTGLEPSLLMANVSKGRALELVNEMTNRKNSTVRVKMKYKVKASGFKGVIIDGQPQRSAEGYLLKATTTSNGIKVTVDWDGSGEWEFVASEINNLDNGRKMKMSPNPLKSNGRTSSFNLIYS